MQNSKVTKPLSLPLTRQQLYHWLFVLLLAAAFLSVMLMSNGEGYTQFESHFYGKFFLIENFNRLRKKLGDHVFPSVLIGKDGWMEYTKEKNIDEFQNALHFSPGELQTAAERIQACYQHAREHDMTFLIVVAPSKVSIYPDKLAQPIQPVHDLSRLNQLNTYLRAHQVPEVLDLAPVLRQAREKQDVYHKLGTHWNDYGAYVAYKAIIETLSHDHPDLEPYPAKFFHFRNTTKVGYSRKDRALADLIQAKYLASEPTLTATRDLEGVVYQLSFGDEQRNYHQISWIPESSLPSLVVFHDSFGIFSLNKFLSLNFSKASYIHRNASPQYLNWKAIEQFSPTVVIYEVVERYLYLLPNDLSGCLAN